MNRRISGLLIGLITGVSLFVGATAIIVFIFWRLLPEAPNRAVDHVFGELMFWTSPLFFGGLLLAVLLSSLLLASPNLSGGVMLAGLFLAPALGAALAWSTYRRHAAGA